MKRKIKMETIEIFAPSHWASALINLDYSGLSKDDIIQLNNFLCEHDLSIHDCLDCEDSGFMWEHDASHITGGADCQKYIFWAYP